VSSLRVGRAFAWAVRQVISAALILLGASLLLFAVVSLAPGGRGGEGGGLVVKTGSPEGRVVRAEASWLADYSAWAGGALRGDFGRSATLQRGRPVGELLVAGARRSLALSGAALALSAAVALALAVLAAARPCSPTVRAAGGVAHFFSTLPVFLCAYAAVAGGNALVAWGGREGWWSMPGWFPLPSRDAWLPWCGAVAVLALADGLLADLYHRFRSELEQAARGEYLVGVRLLALSVPLAMARGVLPGAVSHLVRRIGFVLGSVVVLESTLGWPGLGYLAWRAAAERDLPVLLGVAVVLAVVVRLAVLSAEAVWYAADPRGRAGP